MKAQYYVGLMSGTSMDGVDAVLVDFSQEPLQVIATHEEPLLQPLLNQLHQLANPDTNDITLLGQCDRACGELFAKATLNLLSKANIQAEQVIAIGSHGQTVRHMPNIAYPFSMQIGDASTIATITGIDTIADFRRKDIALGGQGAPLVPAFHHQLFTHQQHSRVILNIGGISNITFINAGGGEVSGYDTGPGNTLLDAWYAQHNDGSYDKSGHWAKAGTVNGKLLERLLSHPYFDQQAPKSTGRELFNLSWLYKQLNELSPLNAQDVQATLAQFTAITIANEIVKLAQVSQVYVCGGGVFNDDLMARIHSLLSQAVESTQALGLAPQWVEAIAFAWLAYRFVEKKPSNLPQVTGASKAAILGAYYPAS